MTPQTAKEFERTLHNIFWHEQYADSEGQRLLVAAIKEHETAVRLDERRKTLEETTKLWCDMCENDDVPTNKKSPKTVAERILYYHDDGFCEASALHSLIAELQPAQPLHSE